MPADITSTGDRVLITFETDGGTEAPGWLLEYRGEIPIYCLAINMLDDQSGELTDGSGPRDYFNNTSCIWMISPPDASELTVYFSDFNTEEVYDYVKVYDLATQELLANYSGNITPDPVTSSSGKMSIRFTTNGSITAPGWNAYYETDLVGIEENLVDQSLKLFPNPANDQITLTFNALTDQNVIIRISSISGREVLRQEASIEKGTNSININTASIENGLYLISIHHPEGSVHRKLIIQ
jgi:hypothetical protein